MARDPYKYFRIEGRELVEALTRGVLDLEKGPATKELIGRLLRFAHTLKGAARVVRLARVAELAHELEERLAPFRDAGGPVPAVVPGQLLRAIDAVAVELAGLGGDEERRPAPLPPAAAARAELEPVAPEPGRETLRVEVADADAVLEGIAEATVRVGGLRRHVRTAEEAARLAAATGDLLDRAGGPPGSGRGPWPALRASLERLSQDLGVAVEQTERQLEEVRERADELRLVAASEAFGALERATRDAAQSLGKRVVFAAHGGEVRLDSHVLAAVSEALLHVVRNAVVHGIEPEAVRVAAGKPPTGTVALTVERRGGRVTFTCRDDGRGIDVDAVRRAAVARGSIPAAEAGALDLERAVSLLLRGGVSTAGAVTQMAGRGVGLDVVRDVAARLRGEVELRSDGGGTTVALRVPVSLWSIQALVVGANGATVSIPLDAVTRALRVGDGEVVRSGGAASILVDDALIPFLPLAAALQKTPRPVPRPRAWSVIVIRAGDALAALGVDRVHGTSLEVVRRLPVHLGPIPCVAGASFDADGNPRLMLEPPQLVARAGAGGEREAAADPRPVPPVLVIDDSLTTRMLEQSILETAGYEVELATSAEEGLEKARARRFGVFVVDVEMPGMDGYEFVASTREDPVLGQTPAILVTSRGGSEDRRRGERAGAHAYIVKGEFDQGRLLSAVAELIGPAHAAGRPPLARGGEG